MQQENDLLQQELHGGMSKMEHLAQSNSRLTHQVQQLKATLKEAHVRYEGDLQRTAASLQEQYHTALELLQLGAGPAPPGQPKAEPSATSQQPQPDPPAFSNVPAGATTAPASCCTGTHRPQSTRAPQPQQHHSQLNALPPQRPATAAGPCKCQQRTASCSCCPHAASAATSASGIKQSPLQPEDDPRLTLLGLGPDDFIAPSAVGLGGSPGFGMEPLAVLRDVLNLDGSRDRRQQQQQTQHQRVPKQPHNRPVRTGESASVEGAADPAGSLLAQAQFESRLRGAYRSMLLQLQHRYQLERERQDDAHKAALQEQESRHLEELRQLAAAQQAELARAARRLERHEMAGRAEVQRLEAQLAAARTAAETSHSQAAAARAAAESLQAQLQLQRTTHEAELHHVRQGSMPLEEHEEAVRRLQAAWDAALQQRERDYSALLSELAEMRRQLSSSNGTREPSRSSGNSCGHGPANVSPLAPTACGCRPAAAAADGEYPAAPAIRDRACGGSSPEPESARESRAGARSTADHPSQQQQQQHYGERDQQQRNRDADFGVLQYVPVATKAGLRVRFEPAEDRDGGGDGGRQGASPARSAGSAAAAAARRLDSDVCGQLLACLDEASEEAEGSASSTPRSRAPHAATAAGPVRGRRRAGEGPTPSSLSDPARPGSSGSRLSDLVGAVVQYGSSAACHEFAVDEEDGGERLAADAKGVGQAGGGSWAFEGGGGGGVRCSSEGLDEYLWRQQQQRQPQGLQRQAWSDAAGRGSSGRRDGEAADSPDHHASEVTLGRWQREVPSNCDDDAAARDGPGSWAEAPPQRLHSHTMGPDEGHGQGGGLGPSGGPQWTAADGRAQQPLAAAAGARADGARGRGAAGAGAPRSRSPSPPPPPLRAESSWGRTGNPAAGVVLPRCLRCGLNDASSPGCCRFHPALLAQPGGLRFTPEWMTCEAAGHTARTPGCLVRCEHFYEPGVRLQQLLLQEKPVEAAGWTTALPPRRQTGGNHPAAAGPAAAAPIRGYVGGGDVVDEGGSSFRGPFAQRVDRRSSGGGGGVAAPPVPAGAGGRRAAAGAGTGSGSGTSPLRRSAAPTRSPPGRGGPALTKGKGGGVAGGALGGGAADSPSPKPRTRLPSPMRR